MTTTPINHRTGFGVASGLKKLLQAASLGAVALIALGALGAKPAQAAIGTTDNVPGATLLLPYFETDLSNENGPQTALRVTNASATAILINVTLWTDEGVPTISFPIYETGFDSTDVDLRLVFKGVLPASASAGQDPTDKISPHGIISQDINFASCNGVLPLPALDATTVTAIRNAHTGQSSSLFGGMCGGAVHGDNVARGYITMDVVNQCGGPALPTDPGYFGSGGSGKATNQNVMIGTVAYVDRSRNEAFSEPLVSIEAAPGSGVNGFNPPDPLVDSAGDYTFYGRLVGFNAADNREPLASITQGRYLNGGIFASGTDLIVWRDPGVVVTPVACGNTPAGFPLGQNEAVAADEQENLTVVAGSPFPLATQKVSSGALSPYTFGFFRLNLTRSGGDPAIDGRQQSYVSMHYRQDGTSAAGLPAQQINNASNPANTNSKVIFP